jgi:hypothetical protein
MNRTHTRSIFVVLLALAWGCGSDSPTGGSSDEDESNVESGGDDDAANGDGADDDSADDDRPSDEPDDDSTTDESSKPAPGKPEAGVGKGPDASVDAGLPGRDSGTGPSKSDAASADPAGDESDGGAPPTSAGGKLPRVTSTNGPGPFNGVVKVKMTEPGGWLIYPKDIGKDGIKHPLFVFGPGGGTTPQTYEQMGMHWDRYGSYGFVVYVLPRSTGDGAPMKAGLDWLIKQNDVMSSPLYQKLDTTKICAAGHSQGSVTTFAFMPDDRVTTTIHISGGSFDGMGPSKLKKPTMFICAPDEVATPQCEGDFKNTKVPTFYTLVQGATHLTSGRLGWEAVIAWMLWHLADQEDQWKKEFVEPTGKFHMGIYKSQVKNWN